MPGIGGAQSDPGHLGRLPRRRVGEQADPGGDHVRLAAQQLRSSPAADPVSRVSAGRASRSQANLAACAFDAKTLAPAAASAARLAGQSLRVGSGPDQRDDDGQFPVAAPGPGGGDRGASSAAGSG